MGDKLQKLKLRVKYASANPNLKIKMPIIGGRLLVARRSEPTVVSRFLGEDPTSSWTTVGFFDALCRESSLSVLTPNSRDINRLKATSSEYTILSPPTAPARYPPKMAMSPV